MTRPGTAARGFTLIEVLVALAIVVVGVGALLSTLSSAAETAAYLRDKTLAEWVGFNQIATARLALTAPVNGTVEGDVDYAGRKYHYQQEIQDLQLPGLRRIDVHVALVVPGKTPDKDAWTTTVSGILGAALTAPNGVSPEWDNGAFPGRPVPVPPGGTPAAAGPNGPVTTITPSPGGAGTPGGTALPGPR